MRNVTRTLVAVLLLVLATPALAKTPQPTLAGVTLGMEEDVAQETLLRRGKRAEEKRDVHEEEKEQESWSLDSGTWGYVSFGVVAGRVDWVTAFVRPEGPRVRFRDVGSLDHAKRTGTYYMTWNVPAKKEQAAFSVIARGTDSVYVSSVSILNAPPAGQPAEVEPPH